MNTLYPHRKSVEAAERGGETELRFFEAMQCPLWKKPFWLIGLHHATREQDLKGIDAIALLSVGAGSATIIEHVEVQIKTSHTGRRDHIAHYGLDHVVIVVSPLMSATDIRHTATDILYRRRGYLYFKHNCRTAPRWRR